MDETGGSFVIVRAESSCPNIGSAGEVAVVQRGAYSRADDLGLSVRNHRDVGIDVLKGIGILLVVLGHSLNEGVRPGSTLSTIVTSFHMPLFMMVSGFLTAGRVHRPFVNWIGRKARQLLIPYAVYVVLAYVLKFGFADTTVGIPDYLLHSVIVPDPAVWFLYALFACFVLLAVCALLDRWLRGWAPAAMAVVLWAVYALSASKILGLAYLHWYWPFFAAAYLYGTYRHRLGSLGAIARWVAVPVFPALLVLTWTVQPAPWFQEVHMGHAPGLLAAMGLCLGFAGTSTSALVASSIAGSRIAGPLAWLGKRTLEIYVLHEILWGIWLWNLQGPMPTMPESLTGSLALFGALLSGALLLSSLARRIGSVAALAVGAPIR